LRSTVPPVAEAKVEIVPLHVDALWFHVPEQTSKVRVGGFVVSPLLFAETKFRCPAFRVNEPALIKAMKSACFLILPFQLSVYG